MSIGCVHCGERSLIWDGDYSSYDFGYESDGVVRTYHCASCNARYEVFVPDGVVKPTRHRLEWLLRKFVILCDAQPTYNDVDECIRAVAPHFIRWSNGKDCNIWLGEIEE